MEQIYLQTAPKLQDSFTFVTKSQVMDGTDPEDQMLLTNASHKLVAKSLNVPDLGAEVERAVHQVEASLDRAKAFEEERQKLETDRKLEQEVQEKEHKS